MIVTINKPTVGRIVHVFDMRMSSQAPLAAIVAAVEAAEPDVWCMDGAWISAVVFAPGGHAPGWLNGCTPDDLLCSRLPHRDAYTAQKTRYPSLGPYVWSWPPR